MAASKVSCRAPMVLMLNILANRECGGGEDAGGAGEAIYVGVRDLVWQLF